MGIISIIQGRLGGQARVKPIHGKPRGRTDEEQRYYALSEKVYAYFAPFYDVTVSPLAGFRREVVRASGAGTQSTILDVATGTGAQAMAFAAACKSVVGVDLSEAMLRVAQRKNQSANLRFLRADAAELPFDDQSFDVSCVSFALHEMPSSVRERVLKEMSRVTAPNGTVVVVDYGLPHNRLFAALVYHAVKLYERDQYAEFVRSDLRALLESTGIRVREERPALYGGAKVVIGTKAP